MENTWASGAIELLKHAESHINLDTAFDKRIAFISIDNSVEITIRTFLSLPKSKSGINISHKELKDAELSFTKLLALLNKKAQKKLVGIDESDIEHYHRIRNTLYHNGTGLSVDKQYLFAYRSIAKLLLKNLFQIEFENFIDAPNTLEKLITNWNKIEELLRKKIEGAGIDYAHTYKWEQAFQKEILSPEIVHSITDLRLARNKLVHSITIKQEDIDYWVLKSDEILNQLKS